MKTTHGLTLAELLVTLAILAVALLIVIPLLIAPREEARLVRCRNNLNLLARGFAAYLGDLTRFYPYPVGRGARPDAFNGAEWLAALYWTGVVTDPSIFLCPNSGDTNHDGVDIGMHRVPPTFGSQTVSYAAMHYRNGCQIGRPGFGHRIWSYNAPGTRTGWTGFGVATDQNGRPAPGAAQDSYPPMIPMASDDTQGTVNHGRRKPFGLCVLFFDGHVEFWTKPQIDPASAVGRKPGPLWLLSN